jgi:hypothetical protein
MLMNHTLIWWISFVDEDVSVVDLICSNDSDLPTTEPLTTNPTNLETVDNNGTPNDPSRWYGCLYSNPTDYNNGIDVYLLSVCNTFGDPVLRSNYWCASYCKMQLMMLLSNYRRYTSNYWCIYEMIMTYRFKTFIPQLNGTVVINDNGTPDPSDDNVTCSNNGLCWSRYYVLRFVIH